ncbi:MAG: RusA family crossover junction endodeoxyribonuclease [Ktedonobacteraceae bacterium]
MHLSADSQPDFYCIIPIAPVPKGRPRFAKGGWAYTDARTKAFEKECAHAFALAMGDKEPFNCPLSIDVLFQMHRPKVPKWSVPAVKPDLDNLFKGVMDAANKIVYTDDGLIVHQTATKIYGEPMITVSLWRVE